MGGLGHTLCAMKKRATDKGVGYCDLMCRYAEVPKGAALDGSGSCRTFIAMYCTRRNSLVPKNLPCKEKQVRKSR